MSIPKKNEVTVDINIENIDEVKEKVSQLNELLEKTIALIDSLNEKKLNIHEQAFIAATKCVRKRR